MDKIENEKSFRLKKIKFNGSTVLICLQVIDFITTTEDEQKKNRKSKEVIFVHHFFFINEAEETL